MRHSNLVQLQRFLGCLSMEKEELLALCLKYRSEGLKLRRNSNSTVNCPSDFYAILASHVLMEQYEETSNNY